METNGNRKKRQFLAGMFQKKNNTSGLSWSLDVENQETREIPIYQETEQIEVYRQNTSPIAHRMKQRSQWINAYIHANIGDVIFTKDGYEYLVKRISRFEETEFYVVVYIDYEHKEQHHLMYRYNDIKLPMGGY